MPHTRFNPPRYLLRHLPLVLGLAAATTTAFVVQGPYWGLAFLALQLYHGYLLNGPCFRDYRDACEAHDREEREEQAYQEELRRYWEDRAAEDAAHREYMDRE